MPSSVVRSYCYDAETAELLINFQSGRSYTYQDVPRGVASGLKCAPSKGIYFNRHIRNKFSFVRNADSRWALRASGDQLRLVTTSARTRSRVADERADLSASA